MYLKEIFQFQNIFAVHFIYQISALICHKYHQISYRIAIII